MHTITASQLRSMGACESGLEDFTGIFGSSPVDVTMENCLRINYNYRHWFAEQIASGPKLSKYHRTCVDARSNYLKHTDTYAIDPQGIERLKYRKLMVQAFLDLWDAPVVSP